MPPAYLQTDRFHSDGAYLQATFRGDCRTQKDLFQREKMRDFYNRDFFLVRAHVIDADLPALMVSGLVGTQATGSTTGTPRIALFPLIFFPNTSPTSITSRYEPRRMTVDEKFLTILFCAAVAG